MLVHDDRRTTVIAVAAGCLLSMILRARNCQEQPSHTKDERLQKEANVEEQKVNFRIGELNPGLVGTDLLFED